MTQELWFASFSYISLSFCPPRNNFNMHSTSPHTKRLVIFSRRETFEEAYSSRLWNTQNYPLSIISLFDLPSEFISLIENNYFLNLQMKMHAIGFFFVTNCFMITTCFETAYIERKCFQNRYQHVLKTTPSQVWHQYTTKH